MNHESGQDQSSPGCSGCLGFITFCFVIWVLIFGITVDGIHHRIECTMDRGVEVLP